jgi:hypothetical protein
VQEKMKKRTVIAIATVLLIAVSFAIMGQPRSLLRIHSSRPLVLAAHLCVVIAWLSLGFSALRAWRHQSPVWMRSVHFGLSVATFIMVLFYRWAYTRMWAGIPVQVCRNFFDGGGRRWFLSGVLIDFAFWTAVFAGACAVAIVIKMRCTTKG